MWVRTPCSLVLYRACIPGPVSYNVWVWRISCNLLEQLEDGERYGYHEGEETELERVPCFQTEGADEEGYQSHDLQQQEHHNGYKNPPQLALPGCEITSKLTFHQAFLGRNELDYLSILNSPRQWHSNCRWAKCVILKFKVTCNKLKYVVNTECIRQHYSCCVR